MRIVGGVNGLTGPLKKTGSSLNKTNRELSKVLNRLSTAKRINRASDDAAGLSISERLRSQTRGFKSASRNVADGLSALRNAEGAGSEITDMVQRQRELAVQASSDTLTDNQRAQLDNEFQQLTQEINRTAESTNFNTQDVANGEGLADGDAVIQADPNPGDTLNLEEVDMRSDSLGLTGLSIATGDSARNAVAGLDSALDTLNSERTTLGAEMNRMESVANNLNTAEINTQAAESVIRDQDMAEGIAQMVSKQLLMESQTSAFSHYNQISGNHVLGLLQ